MLQFLVCIYIASWALANANIPNRFTISFDSLTFFGKNITIELYISQEINGKNQANTQNQRRASHRGQHSSLRFINL
jgi:hypothetical protein